MKFLILTAIFLLIALVSCFDLKCNAKTGSLSYNGTVSYCEVTSPIITSPGQTITSVNGLTTPTTFQGIYIQSFAVNYLPQGLSRFFPDLNRVFMFDTGLKSMNAADFTNLTALECLIIVLNPITELHSDLFKHTPNIKYLHFDGNQIEFVGKDLLTNLTSLNKLHFQSNKCIDSYATTDVETVKTILQTQCSYPDELRENFMRFEKGISDMKAKILEEVRVKDKEIGDLKAEIEKLKKTWYNGLLDSSTKLLHEETKKLETCKAETNVTFVDKLEIIVEVLSITEADVSVSMNVASPETKIVKVQDASGSEVKPNQAELVINQQNTLFLPTNLDQFFPSTQRLSVTFSGLYSSDSRSFQNMKHLSVVSFTGNKLVEISEAAFLELKGLKNLDLSHNNIEVINENAFKTNLNLEIVKLNHNKLVRIDGQLFNNHKKLQKLFLHENKLKYINAKLLTSLDALEVVDLSSNSCIDLSLASSTLKEIFTTIADNCTAFAEITCREEIVDGRIDETHCEVEELVLVQPGTKLLLDDQISAKKIEKFLIIYQKMLFIPRKLSETLPNLVQFVIKQSKLTVLQKTDFEGLSLLEKLTIEENSVSLIEEGVFDEIPQITHLNLANNKIQSLPSKAFIKLMKLQTLILKGNKLKKFTVNLLPPKENVIKNLQLQQNQLKLIESKILSLLLNAEVIDLTDNECISVKYQKSDPKRKSIKVLTRDLNYACADDF